MGLSKGSGLGPSWYRIFRWDDVTAPSSQAAQGTHVSNLYTYFIVEASPLVTLARGPEIKKTRKQKDDSSGQD